MAFLTGKKMNKRSYKHGLSKHPLYRVWSYMKERCYNKNTKYYKYYGGRGITVCNEWREFLQFYHWAINNRWEKGLQIDRINNDGNYKPSNFRFVTCKINNANKSNGSKYGVGIYKNNKKFIVRIRINGKLCSFGTYNTTDKAQQAYQQKILEINK